MTKVLPFLCEARRYLPPCCVLLVVACTEVAQGPLDESTLGGDPVPNVGGGGAAAGSVGMSGGGVGVTPSAGTSAGPGGTGGTPGAGGVPSAGAGGGGGMTGGGMAGGSGVAGSGMAGSGGAGATGHRYARFVAKTELGGAMWSAVAELQLFTTGSAPISRSNWVISADSEETVDQTAPATAAIDNDPATYWHTAWDSEGTSDAPLPHQLTIDLGAAQPITGFSYLPRQDQANGRVGSWEFFLSNDGTTWGTAVKSGTFPAGTAEQTVSF